MTRRRKMDLGQGPVDVVEEPFKANVENWNEYMLDDGTVLRVKTVVTEILRVENQFDLEGNPAYLIKSQNVTAVSAPEGKRKGGQ